jgi:hypothetical protein
VLRFRGADNRPDLRGFWKVLSGRITLEGLDLVMGGTAGDTYSALLYLEGGTANVACCRFRCEGAQPYLSGITTLNGLAVTVLGCEFIGPFHTAIGHFGQVASRLRVEGCLVSGPLHAVLLNVMPSSDHDVEVALRRNTFAGNQSIRIDARASDADATAEPPSTPPGKGIRVAMTGNVLGGEKPFFINFLDGRKGTVPTTTEGTAYLRRVFRWREEANLYPEQAPLLRVAYGKTDDPYWGWFTPPAKTETVVGDLATWERFWGLKDTGSRAATIQYAGGAGLPLQQALRKTGPAAYLLHPDTLKGLDDKMKEQVGISADLVGPGAAYERWKRTPAYQEWLKAMVGAN